MASKRITQLTADASPSTTDIVPTVKDPGGTPLNRKVTLAAILALGSGGGLPLLEEHIASGSATLDFTTFLSASYNTYLFDMDSVLPVTSTADLWVRMGTGAGPTWDAGANYTWGQFQSSQLPNFAAIGAAAQNQIKIGHSLGNGVTDGVSGELMLYNPQSAVVYKRLTTRLANLDSAGNFVSASGSGQYLSATALTGIRFLMSSGNIASGTIRVYGIPNS